MIWSSAAAHAAGRRDAVAEGAWLAERTAGWICTWGEYLREPDDPEVADRLRQLENTGRPMGERPFVERLATTLGRDPLPNNPAASRWRRNRYGVPLDTIPPKCALPPDNKE